MPFYREVQDGIVIYKMFNSVTNCKWFTFGLPIYIAAFPVGFDIIYKSNDYYVSARIRVV